MKRRIFEKPGLGPRVFALFSKYDFQGPVKGGLGGFKYDFFDVMLDSIYDDILCMALTCKNYHSYINRLRDKALGGDPTRRYGEGFRPCRGAFC